MRHPRRSRIGGLGILLGGSLLLGACGPPPAAPTPPATATRPTPTTRPMTTESPIHARRRARMVETQLRRRDIRDRRVLDALGRVPRHEFVPPSMAAMAYDDGPLAIGHEQTISQPYIVALMTQLAAPGPNDRVLDVGTGSGYQAAVLGELAGSVDSIEIVEPLATEARARLARLGYRNVTVRHGDGWRGWPEHAPYQAIILAAAPREVPPALLEQLAPGGRLVLPVGGQDEQELLLITKCPDGSVDRRRITPVRFVPMTGGAQQPPAPTPD